MTTRQRKSRPIRVGQRVRFPLIHRSLIGVVKEDRGNLGVQGRQLVVVEVPMDPDNSSTYLMSADELEVLDANDAAAMPLEKEAIINYLKRGGLLQILQTAMPGGRNSPQVWLCRDSLGHVTHTFIKDRGIIGGKPGPCLALYGDRIFDPKVDEVTEFLCSFGLARDEARGVVRAVGKAP